MFEFGVNVDGSRARNQNSNARQADLCGASLFCETWDTSTAAAVVTTTVRAIMSFEMVPGRVCDMRSCCACLVHGIAVLTAVPGSIYVQQ